MRVKHRISTIAAIAAALMMLHCSMDVINPDPIGLGELPDEDTLPTIVELSTDGGNCLSFPVIWSDGVAKELRGTFGETMLEGAWTEADDPQTAAYDLQAWYHQQDGDNEWQAESRDQLAAGPLEISRIDWGDNIEVKAGDDHSTVRIETVLYRDLAEGDEMTAFRMLKLNDFTGSLELWGTNGETYTSGEATVYSGCARLTIQKLALERDDPLLDLSWDVATGEWTGDVAGTVLNGGVWEESEGHEGYSGERDVQGKCIYGYTWHVKDFTDAVRDYRVTFSLDNTGASPSLNTRITEATTIVAPEEDEGTSGGGGGNGNGNGNGGNSEAGGLAKVAGDFNLSYIDIRITQNTTGRGN